MGKIFTLWKNSNVVSFPAMFDPANTSTPQFGTAEYVGTPGADICHFCKQPTPQQYYRVRGQMACGTCAEIARQETPVDSHSAYGRALLFGIGAAVVGMAGYALLIIILQGWTIGYMSLGVGYIVGKAMVIGSKGLGGRKYQITAALLTYAAVSIAAVPVQLSFAYKHAHTETKQVQSDQQPTVTEDQSSDQPSPEPRMSFWGVIGQLALYGLASPFYDLQNSISGVLGLIILFVGIRIAWRITQGQPDLAVTGPYNSSSPKLA